MKRLLITFVLLSAVNGLAQDMGIIWEKNLSGASAPLVADMLGDKKPEILTSSGGYVYYYNAAGIELKRAYIGDIVGSFILVDVNGDGRFELVYSTGDGNVTASDANASVLWSYSSGERITAPAFYNASKEIVFGSLEKNLHALNLAGEKQWTMKVMGGIEHQIHAADADKDGREELLFGSDDGTVYDIDRNRGRILTFNIGGGVAGTPQAKDVNSDGRVEILAVSKDAKAYALVLPTGTGGNQKVSIKWNYTAQGASESAAAIGDLNGDYRYETLYSASDKGQYSEDSAVYILNYSGKLIKKYTTRGFVVSQPLISDINGDGKRDISFGTDKGSFYVLDQNASAYWNVELAGRIENTPAAYDLDGDRRAEIILASDRSLYVIGSLKDNDSDGITDYRERMAGTNLSNADSDGDGLSDQEDPMPLNNSLKYADSDLDGISDYDENRKGSNPHMNDTDDDGILDGKDPKPLENELKLTDSDNDTLSDYIEKKGGTNRYNADSDDDGINDSIDPKPLENELELRDSDNDTLNDYEESRGGTDPHKEDTDGDGLKDAEDPDPLAPEEKEEDATTTTQPEITRAEDQTGVILFVLALAALLFMVQYVPPKRKTGRSGKKHSHL